MLKHIKTLHIIVEGADGIGKSTLSKKLSTKLKLPLLRMVKAKKAFTSDTIEDLSIVFNHTLLQLKDTNYVVDRGPISSIIFSKVYERTDDLEYIYSICEKINPLAIYLTSTDRQQMFNQRKKDRLIDTAHRKKIYKEYANFFKTQNTFKVLKINVKNKTRQDVLDAVLNYLIKEQYITKDN